MSEELNAKPPIWFWIVSGLAFVWNLMGVSQYLARVSMSPEEFANYAQLTEAQQAAIGVEPAWFMGAFAIAVFGGALGCLAMLIRKKWATLLLALSLLAVLSQQLYFWVLTDMGSKLAGFNLWMTIAIPVIALLLLLMARSFATKGWLR